MRTERGWGFHLADIHNLRVLEQRFAGSTRGKEHIPSPVLLIAIAAPSPRESLFQNAQVMNVCEVEIPPTALSAACGSRSREGQKALDAVLDAVVMRLRDSDATRFVGELDETLLANGAHEVCVHD